ncbi:MAG TPA: carbamoyltransferase C-terminal domain-containing protein [Candidatus Binataceae bacterium]|nr:carbamoyltransferase C-terminal domain-containing protein [Candidatus Binataceae bacterium]
MYILGINAYHAGAAACLIKDGQLIAAAEEERFSRVKYCADFPVKAINYCLSEAGITPYDLDHIGFSKDPAANLSKKLIFAVRRRPRLRLIQERLSHMGAVRDGRRTFAALIGAEACALRAQFHHVEHHRAHLASAFFVSPFREAALLSIDGFGDFVSTMTGIGRDNRIEPLSTVNYPHSLGIFFTAVTQWLGFTKFGDEGKIQGLAGYGKPLFADRLRRLMRLQADGSFDLDLDYFIHWAEGVEMTWAGGTPSLGTIYSQQFVDDFGPPRTPGAELTPFYINMAASLQAVLEEAEMHIVRRLYQHTGQQALCMAGGVALNSSFNGKILPQSGFTDVFIQPAANDAGTALGVAYYIYNQTLDQPRGFVMREAYTGPSFDNGTIERTLKRYGAAYEVLDDDVLARRTAALAAKGKVIGWFQGRMEWGPRALGNRSIVADPRRPEMKEVLNARIKHREPFRPFAPSVLAESVGDYFDQSYPDPFMTKVYAVRANQREGLAAVTHVDGTGRLQTVERSTNPRYWQLINQFRELTGTAVVLNTSFNENEPIVCRPEEALGCFARTRMDALVVGNYLLCK